MLIICHTLKYQINKQEHINEAGLYISKFRIQIDNMIENYKEFIALSKFQILSFI